MEKGIQKEGLNSEELGLVIDKIVAQFDVEQIYLNSYSKGNDSFNELLILISNKFTGVLSELMPLMHVILDQSVPRYRLFHAHQVKDRLKQGNLFFYGACTGDKLVYSLPGSSFELYPEEYSISAFLDVAKHNFTKEMSKTQIFMDGALFYSSRGNFAQTTFMLHQVMELVYRAAELLVMGRDKKTHSIKSHQKYIAGYIPLLSNVFAEGDKAEADLLKTLDEAYLAVRYENTYYVSESAIKAFFEKAKQVQQLTKQIYEDLINDFEQCVSNTGSLTVKPEKNEVVNELMLPIPAKSIVPEEILLCIKASISLERVYCFGNRFYSETVFRTGLLTNDDEQNSGKMHYDLFLISTDGQTDVSVLQHELNNQIDKSYSVTLLLHTVEEVLDDLNKNKWFFASVLQKAKLVYDNGSGKLPHSFKSGKRKYDYDVMYYKYFNRQRKAKVFLETAEYALKNRCWPVAVSLINQSMEQLCAGAMYLLIGYKPKQHSLSNLIMFCRNFVPMLDRVFSQESTDKKLLTILIKVNNLIKYSSAYTLSFTEASRIHEKCKLLFESIKALCMQKLNQFEPLEANQLPLSTMLEFDSI